MTDRVVRKYLERYAEPEGVAAGRELALTKRYERILVVPVRGEEPGFLRGFRRPPAPSGGARALWVIVTNAPELSPETPAEADQRRALLKVLGAPVQELTSSVTRHVHERADVVLVDRASPGRELRRKGGVGAARKVGTDFALSLWSEGGLVSPNIHMTDADAVLPADYFAQTSAPEGQASHPTSPVAWVYPFRHVLREDRRLYEAHALYETSLRHYVLGLRHAGSPYAFHTIGSCMAVRADALAAVRGVPRREAGEDFYLLEKLAKVGPIAAATSAPVELRARSSARVPFGTGPAVAEILQSANWEAYTLYNPGCFRVLARFIETLDACARDKSAQPYQDFLDEQSGGIQEALSEYLSKQRAPGAIKEAVLGSSQPSQVRRRLHTWFDGIRTLRFVHTLRDAGLGSLPFRQALQGALKGVMGAPSEELLRTGTPLAIVEAVRELDCSWGPMNERLIRRGSAES